MRNRAGENIRKTTGTSQWLPAMVRNHHIPRQQGQRRGHWPAVAVIFGKGYWLKRSLPCFTSLNGGNVSWDDFTVWWPVGHQARNHHYPSHLHRLLFCAVLVYFLLTCPIAMISRTELTSLPLYSCHHIIPVITSSMFGLFDPHWQTCFSFIVFPR